MSDLSSYLELVGARRAAYPTCPDQQALVYACEDVVDQELGSPVVPKDRIADFIGRICRSEDIEAPSIAHARSGSVRASADPEGWTICINGRDTTSSVLLHELAHLTVGADSHGVVFRDELVRLVRAHVSVQHAAMLHSLFTGVHLEMSPWEASTRRH